MTKKSNIGIIIGIFLVITLIIMGIFLFNGEEKNKNKNLKEGCSYLQPEESYTINRVIIEEDEYDYLKINCENSIFLNLNVTNEIIDLCNMDNWNILINSKTIRENGKITSYPRLDLKLKADNSIGLVSIPPNSVINNRGDEKVIICEGNY